MPFSLTNIRHLGSIVLLFLICVESIFAVNTNDSLINILNKTSDKSTRLKIYRDLADLNNYTPDEFKYLIEIYKLTEKTVSDPEKASILSEIAIALCDQLQADSAKYYTDLLNKIPVSKEVEKYRSCTSMLIFYMEPSEEKALNEKVASFKKERGVAKSIYSQIEQAYIVAAALYFQDKSKEAVPYIESAAKLAEKLPLKDGYDYKEATMRLLARIYIVCARNKEAITIIENLINLKETYYNSYLREIRPYYPMKQFYIRNYTSLLINSPYLEKEKADKYMEKVKDLCSTTSNPSNKYSCFLSMNNYYLSRGNLKKAIETNDSLIKYATSIAPYNLQGLYEFSSTLYERSGNYKKALSELKKSYEIKDSIGLKNIKDDLNILQVEYGMNKLEYEKSILEIKNKQIINIAMSVTLTLAFIICVYLYINFKKKIKRTSPQTENQVRRK